MKKEDVLAKIDANPNMPKGELKTLINSISLKGKITLKKVKPGDIFAHHVFKHPVLVLKQLDKSYVCLMITTTLKDCFMMTKLECRYIDIDCYITNAMIVSDFETISTNYMYTIETKELNRIKKLFKEFVIKLL